MRIRKQIETLTLQDLDQYPTWEFAIDEEGVDGQDECTVRPVEMQGSALGDVLVKAKFVLADGTDHVGFLTPTDDHPGLPMGLAYIQPVIVTEQGHVGFWNGVLPWDPKEIERYYLILGRSANQVFPITFEYAVNGKDVRIAGEIPGFLQLVSRKKGFFSRPKDDVKIVT